MNTRAYIRSWERQRTAKLNAMGLTSRRTPMKQRRRVYGITDANAAYLRELRQKRKEAGLTVRGTVPIKTLAEIGAQVIQERGLGMALKPAVTLHKAAANCEAMKREAEARVMAMAPGKESFS